MYTFSYILCTSLWAYTQDNKSKKNKPVRVCSTTSSEKKICQTSKKLHEKKNKKGSSSSKWLENEDRWYNKINSKNKKFARTNTKTTIKWLEFHRETEWNDSIHNVYISVWSAVERFTLVDLLFNKVFCWALVVDEEFDDEDDDDVEFDWSGIVGRLRFVSICGIGVWSVFTTVIVDETASFVVDWCDNIGVIGNGCLKLIGKSSRNARRPSLASSFGTSPRSKQRQSGFWYENSLNSSWFIALTITDSIGVNPTGIFVKSLSKLLVSRGLI